ncbi:MAG: FtsX-like permease family protein [Bacilli bacterium]|nr:FtsX-like permease family protein [Bacilli bacterium]
MKILTKLTIKNLILNKKRTIVTIIGIILSIALITAVGGMVTCFRETLLQNAINETGYFHIHLKTNPSNLENLNLNRDIKRTMDIHEIGYSSINSQNEYKPYLKLLSISDPSDFLNFGFTLIDGRYPANNREVVISETISTNGKVEYKIGDIIELNLGSRYACSNLVTKENYLPNEYKYNDQGEIICREENIQVDKTFKVKVVGIIKRPNYSIEAYSEAGYSIITTNLESDNIHSFLILKNPSDYLDIYQELYGTKKYQNLNINHELLRWEIFKFSDGTMNLILTVATIVIIIIMATSIYCIKNSFAISTLEKTKMIGMLSSIGATKKQIKNMVLKEGFILSLIGIPLGILSGILADFILIIVMNKLVGDFVLGSEFVFRLSFISIILAIILGLITIYLSSIRVAIKTSKISPIEAIKNSNEIKIKDKHLKTPRYISKFFKTGGVIAYKNLKRSKKKYRTTVISLVVSILTFITMNTFINYAFSLSGVYYTDYNYDILVYPSDFDDIKNILNLDNIDNYSLIYDTDSIIVNDLSKVSEFVYEIYIKNLECDDYNCYDKKEYTITIKVLDDNSFKRYLESNNLNYNKLKDKVILKDNYLDYLDDKMLNKRVYSYKEGDIIKGSINDIKYNLEIGAVLDNNPIGMENYYSRGGFIFLNQEYYKNLELIPEQLALNTKSAITLEDDIKKLNSNISLNNIFERKREEKSMVILYSIFLYGFITVITLIGVTNIFNTISANITLRQREFAILKSIGMTKKEFNRMINLETIFYSFKALFYGIILGILGSYIIYLGFATNYDKGFIIPLKAILISIIAVILLVFIIMKYSIKKINKQDIIETIRKENV